MSAFGGRAECAVDLRVHGFGYAAFPNALILVRQMAFGIVRWNSGPTDGPNREED
jgi:hypothetical protein